MTDGRAPTAEEQDLTRRLTALEPSVRRLARSWARTASDAEDLAQVARIAVWKLLKERPDAPASHLMFEAKEAVSDGRKRGKSVDGRLDPLTRRPKAWGILSVEALLELGQDGAMAGSGRDALDGWVSPVEGEAMGRLLYQELREGLTARERACLALLLGGYRCREVETLLGLTKQQVHRTREALQRKAMALSLGADGPRPLREQSRREAAAGTAARARWARRPAFIVSPAVRAIIACLVEPWER